MTIKEYQKQYYQDNKEKRKEYREQYYLENNQHINERSKQYNSEHKEEIKEKRKQYNLDNEEKIKQYYTDNKEEILERQQQYTKNKYYTNAGFKLSVLLRTRFYHAIISGHKMKSVIELLGCTVDECRIYFESQFKPEMTWENHGTVWEIDHKIPCSSFDLTDIEQQKQCFHYSNMQPLFKTTEIARSFGYIDEIGNREKGNNK